LAHLLDYDSSNGGLVSHFTCLQQLLYVGEISSTEN